MKTRNSITKQFIEVKPEKNIKFKKGAMFFDKKNPVGIIVKILKDGWLLLDETPVFEAEIEKKEKWKQENSALNKAIEEETCLFLYGRT